MFLTRNVRSAVCTSESSSATEKLPGSMQNAAQPRLLERFGPFWLRFGVRVRVRVRVRVQGLGWVGPSPVP